MTLVMIAYYVISAYLLLLLGWNFVREKKGKNDAVLTLLVMIPLILRILRVK